MPRTAKKIKQTTSSVTHARLKTRRDSLNDAKLAEINTTPDFLSDDHDDPGFRSPPIITSNQIIIKVRSMFLISLGYILFSFFMFIAGGVVTHWLIHHPEHNPFPILTNTNTQIAKKIDEEDYFNLRAKPVATSGEIFPQTEVQQYIVQYASSQNLQTAERMLKQLETFKVEADLLQREDEYGRNEYTIQSKAYKSYDEAYQALAKAPDPYRSWARIDRFNQQGNQE